MINPTTKSVAIKQDVYDRWQWSQHAFRAMNTGIQIRLYSNQANAETILQDIQGLFSSFESRLSRFKPDSELSRLNGWPQELFQASPTLIDALEVALWLAEATGGLYDPTMLDNLEKAGYDRSFEQLTTATPLELMADLSLPPDGQQHYLRPPLTFRSIQLNRAERQIYKPVGLRLDLGGMGKGWTVDRAADWLQGLGPFLVNAGGDIFAYHSPPGQKGWEIDLVHPLKPGQFMARLFLHHRALATSTIARRRWQYQGQMMHHLIDPRTGRPAQTDAISVSVVADRTVMAEVYAKVALILGAERGLALLNQLPGVEGLIYTANSKIIFTPGMSNILDELEVTGFVS